MLSAVSAVFWSAKADAEQEALDRAMRAAIRTGDRAVAQEVTGEKTRLTSLRLPSNKADQPQPTPGGTYSDGQVRVCCDAILTNAGALCAELGLPAGADPAQIIACLYLDGQEAGLDRLDGDFAFVLQDLAQNRVLARRDPFGVRPLFWAWVPEGRAEGRAEGGGKGGLVFASLPDAIADAGLMPLERDVEAVVALVAGSSAARPNTLVKGLYRVPACTQMTFHAAQAGRVPEPRTYWRPGAKPAAAPAHVPRDFDGWAAELRRQMDAAVARRMPVTGDLGASISSGLDSTSVTMLAERHLKEDQHIFATTYAASEAAVAQYPGMMDETKVAQEVVAGSNRITWAPVRLRPESSLNPGKAGLITWNFATEGSPELETPRLAAEQGADVLLTGWGGDNTVSYKGSRTAAALLRTGRWGSLRRMCKGLGRSGGQAARFYARALADCIAPEGTRVRELASGMKRQTLNFNHRMYTGMKPQHRAGSDLLEHRTSDLRANRVREVMSPVLAMRIELLSCHGLRQGIRYVHPLLDRTLIDYSLTCPPQFEFHNGHMRAPIRAAMEGIVPDAARLRTQTGLPFAESGLHFIRMKDEIMETLDQLEQDPRLREMFDFAFVRQSMAQQPSEAEVEAHVKEVSRTGIKTQWPLNSSFMAVGGMLAVQAALDEAEAGEIKDAGPGRLR